jgi:hypothetical protein
VVSCAFPFQTNWFPPIAIIKLHSQKKHFFSFPSEPCQVAYKALRFLYAVHNPARRIHAAVMLNSLVLDRHPQLLIVAWCLALLLALHTLRLEARLGRGSNRARARRSGGGVEDGVGLVHFLVVLLDGFPCFGDVALGLRVLGCGGGFARCGGCVGGGGGARSVGSEVGGVDGFVVGFGAGGHGVEDVGWHCCLRFEVDFEFDRVGCSGSSRLNSFEEQ